MFEIPGRKHLLFPQRRKARAFPDLTVNEAMGALREMGAIETAYRKIVVVDPEILGEVAAGKRN